MLKFLGKLFKNREGATAVIFALSAPVMVGFLGLGAEAGYWYFSYQNLQSAADLGAYTAAMELRSGASNYTASTQATVEATRNGFEPEQGTLVINTPPTSGALAGRTDAAEVILTRSLPRLITGVVLPGNVEMSVRGVAQYSAGSTACVLALNPTASGAMKTQGNADVTLTGCAMMSNSLSPQALIVSGSATISTECVSSAGGVSVNSGLTMSNCSNPIENAPRAVDPYADLDMPPMPTPCQSGSSSGGVTTLSPGRYCGGISLQHDTNLEPGTYFMDGDFTVNGNAEVNGAGVTIIMTNGGNMTFNGTAEIDLSAPTSGDMSGVLFFGDRDDADVDHTINGNAHSTLEGAMYFPEADVNIAGTGDNVNGCTQIIASTVKFSGDATLSANCSSSGTRDLSTPGALALVE